MMWLKWFSCSGLSFFVGCAIMMVSVLGSRRPRKRVLGFAYRTPLVIGAAVVLASATPMPWWAYGLWAALIATWLIVQLHLHEKRPRLVWTFRWIVIVACVGAMAMELPWHFTATVPLAKDQTIYVIGDSLSAGQPWDQYPPWPEVLRDGRHGRVVNLAKSGAKIAGAIRQADGVRGDACLVLLEIGGNDLLGTTSGGDFAAGLDTLLDKVAAPGRTVVMLELPAVPGRNDFGLAQRELARKHGVILIPKWLMVNVISGIGNTQEDNIHLSPHGHEAMAAAVWRLFRLSGATE